MTPKPFVINCRLEPIGGNSRALLFPWGQRDHLSTQARVQFLKGCPLAFHDWFSVRPHGEICGAVPKNRLRIPDVSLEQRCKRGATHAERQVWNPRRSARPLKHILNRGVRSAGHRAGSGRKEKLSRYALGPVLKLAIKGVGQRRVSGLSVLGS